MEQKTHAEKLIESTMQIALRPQKDDRVDLCIAVLRYLQNNFAYDPSCSSDEDDYANMYVDSEDIENLIMELKALK